MTNAHVKGANSPSLRFASSPPASTTLIACKPAWNLESARRGCQQLGEAACYPTVCFVPSCCIERTSVKRLPPYLMHSRV